MIIYNYSNNVDNDFTRLQDGRNFCSYKQDVKIVCYNRSKPPAGIRDDFNTILPSKFLCITDSLYILLLILLRIWLAQVTAAESDKLQYAIFYVQCLPIYR